MDKFDADAGQLEVPADGTPLFIIAHAMHCVELHGAAVIRGDRTRDIGYWIDSLVEFGATEAAPVTALSPDASGLPVAAERYQLLYVIDARGGELVVTDVHDRRRFRMRPRPGDCVIYDRHRMRYGQIAPADWQVLGLAFDGPG